MPLVGLLSCSRPLTLEKEQVCFSVNAGTQANTAVEAIARRNNSLLSIAACFRALVRVANR